MQRITLCLLLCSGSLAASQKELEKTTTDQDLTVLSSLIELNNASKGTPKLTKKHRRSRTAPNLTITTVINTDSETKKNAESTNTATTTDNQFFDVDLDDSPSIATSTTTPYTSQKPSQNNSPSIKDMETDDIFIDYSMLEKTLKVLQQNVLPLKTTVSSSSK